MTTSTFLTLPALIQTRQDEAGITDQHLTDALGYASTSVILMIKAGMMNLPIKHVMALADVLSVDAAEVLRLTVQEKSPELMNVIEVIFNPMNLVGHERDLIRQVRKLAATALQPVTPLVLDGRYVVALLAA